MIEIEQLNAVMARWRRGENVDTRKHVRDFTALESSDSVEELREGVKRLREELTVAELKRERAEAALRAALDPTQNISAEALQRSASVGSALNLPGLLMPMNPSGSEMVRARAPVFGKLAADIDGAPSGYAGV